MSRIFIAPFLLLVSLTVTACGQSEEERRAEEDRRVAAEAQAAEEFKDEERGETAKLCEELVSDFAAALDEMNSRIGVGMQPAEYNTEVGDVSVAYNQTDWDSTPNMYCIQKVGIPLETAFKKYAKAGEIWSDCISDFNCDMEADKLPAMQKRWTEAGELIVKSDASLSDFKLDSETSD